MLLGPQENNGKAIQRKHCINCSLRWMALNRMRYISACCSMDEFLSVFLNAFDIFLQGIILMAATNLPDILDPALTRPGRFDRHVSSFIYGLS